MEWISIFMPWILHKIVFKNFFLNSFEVSALIVIFPRNLLKLHNMLLKKYSNYKFSATQTFAFSLNNISFGLMTNNMTTIFTFNVVPLYFNLKKCKSIYISKGNSVRYLQLCCLIVSPLLKVFQTRWNFTLLIRQC